jgi:hypothetical protein
VKPNDPTVKKVLAETGVAEPTAPPAKPIENEPPQPFKQERAEETFRKTVRGALSVAVLGYLESCPKDRDKEGLEYRLFPERELKEMFPKFLSRLEQRREWMRTAEWKDGKWAPPFPEIPDGASAEEDRQ